MKITLALPQCVSCSSEDLWNPFLRQMFIRWFCHSECNEESSPFGLWLEDPSAGFRVTRHFWTFLSWSLSFNWDGDENHSDFTQMRLVFFWRSMESFSSQNFYLLILSFWATKLETPIHPHILFGELTKIGSISPYAWLSSRWQEGSTPDCHPDGRRDLCC